ncbi:RNA polymerase sigma factor [Spongiibacter tropicus]|uniref:RNA polymerase sigma factor n=1 Tax=Spongiibacter tropicus TaxID=454602 RepID=UPI003A99B325
MPLVSDSRLLARVADGDSRAFNRLVERHSQRVLNVIYRIVLSRSDAEDLCQDVFVRLWKQAPDWQDDAKVSTWLHRVASNLAINHSQRVQQRQIVDSELTEQLLDGQRDEADDEANALSEKLMAALSSLPAEQRAAMAFRYYRDLPVKQIADILDSSPKAVESLLGRARKQLKQVLGESDD